MQVPDEKLVKSFQSSWNCPFYPNKLREFIIKYNGNILGLNTRISHFVADRSRKCTFCTVANRDGNRDETFVHLFFECPSTTGWYTRFEAEYFPEIDFGEVGVRKNFWLCHFATGKNIEKNIFVITLLWAIKLSIWEAKLKKKNPSFVTLSQDMLYIMNGIYNCSERVQITKNFNNFLVCSEWDRIRRGR